MATPLPIGDALFGKTRQAVLALLFGHPDRAFYTREIIGHAHSGTSQVQTELDQLTRTGLVLREQRGNQVHYRANRSAAVYPEIAGLVTKTFGVVDVVRRALAEHEATIDFAAIHGSIAQGAPSATSDVDLLLVTSLPLSQLEQSLSEAEVGLGRKVAATLLDATEFRARLQGGDHFLVKVMNGPLIHLFGDRSLVSLKRERRPRKTR